MRVNVVHHGNPIGAPQDGTVRIEMPWGTFGLICLDGYVIGAAPIASWLIGCRVKHAIDYYVKRGGVAEWVL